MIVGKKLLQEAEDWSREQGCRMMRVRSNVIRKNACNFYLSQGYQDSKQQTVFLKQVIP